MRTLRNRDGFPSELLPVLAYFDNEVERLAAAIGRTPQAVYGWGVRIPKLAAYELDAATKGRFPAHTLNKDCAAHGD